jgi:Zn-dependent protease with chaperone function
MTYTIAILTALLPGALTWWWGRALLARSNDPALAERVLNFRTRRAKISGFAIAATGFLSAKLSFLFVLIIVAGVVAGSFPSRRALFSEKWGFFSYLSFQVRLATAAAGFFIALMLVPQVLLRSREFWWPVAIGLSIFLALWGLFYKHIVCILFQASPLDHPGLGPLIAEINQRASAVPQTVYRAGPDEGVWANAFAVPSLLGSIIVLSKTLVETFSPQEAAAIYAHEVAHIEYFNKKRRLLRSLLAGWLAIAISIVFSWFLIRQTDGTDDILIAFWSLLLFIAIVVKMARNKAHETESDRRAVELCGNAEALATALEKLHALNLMPRRWEPGMERCASHPSLAHRLQDLRKEQPSAPAIDQRLIAGMPSTGILAILEAERVHWLCGVPPDTCRDPALLREKAASVESIVYSEITDLRISTRSGNGATLLAEDNRGRKWKTPIHSDEIKPVQEFLDTVDIRFSRTQAKSGKLSMESIWCITFSLLLSFAAKASAFALITSSVIALVRPYPGPMAAFGTISLGAALIELVRAGLSTAFNPYYHISLIALALLGASCIVLAFMRSPSAADARSRGSILAATILGGFALFEGAFLAVIGLMSVVHLHQYAKIFSSLPLALFGASASLLFIRRRKAGRVLAAALAVLAILPFLAGTDWFLARFSNDSFGGIAPKPQHLNMQNPRFEWQSSLKEYCSELRISPTGDYVAARNYSSEGVEPISQFMLLSSKGPLRQIDAWDLVFLEDGCLLAMSEGSGRYRLGRQAIDGSEKETWSMDLPKLKSPRLMADPASGEWIVIGISPERRDVLRFEGRIGSAGYKVTKYSWNWSQDGEAVDCFNSFYATRDSTIASGPISPQRLWTMWMQSSTLHVLGPEVSKIIAHSGFHVRWVPPRLLDRSIFAFVDSEYPKSYLWKVDIGTGSSECVLSFEDRVRAHAIGLNGHLGFVMDSQELIIADPEHHVASRYSLSRIDNQLKPNQLAVARNHVALLSVGENGSRVDVLKVDMPNEAVRITSSALHP